MSKATYYKWADLSQTPMAPQISRRLVSGEKLMIVEVTLDKGAVVATHQRHRTSQPGQSDRKKGGGYRKASINSAGSTILVKSRITHTRRKK